MFDLLAAAALSITAAAPEPQAARRPAYDPGRRVCKTIKVIGSRLNTQRVCMTAAEWAEERRQTRQGVERLQVRGLRDGQ